MNLVTKLIFPFVVSLFLITISLSGFFYYLELKHQNDLSALKFKDVVFTLNDEMDKDKLIAKDFLKLISKDQHLKLLFENRDRKKLFKYLEENFFTFKKEYGFSHFYIHDLNQTNFLRVHNQKEHSDFINRITLKKAVQTKKLTTGIEFGIYHNLTLRIVFPWICDGELIGYLELGKDLDYYIDRLAKTEKTDIVLTIKNTQLKSEEEYLHWKKVSSNKHLFVELKNFSIVNSTLQVRDKRFLNLLDSSEIIDNKKFTLGNRYFHVYSESIKDFQGADVARLYMLYDNSNAMEYFWQSIIKMFLFIFFVGGLISIYYVKYVRKIDNKLEENRVQIEFNYLFEKYINTISQELLISTDFDKSLNKALEELGTTLEVDRAHIFKYDDDYCFMENTNEWCIDGISPQIDHLSKVPADNLPWWYEQLSDKKPIILNSLDDLPSGANDVKEMLREQNIASLMVHHISFDGKLYGFIGIDTQNTEIKWNDTHLSFLNVTAEVITNILSRKKTEEQLKKSFQQISLTLSTAYNGILVIDKNNRLLLHNERFLEIWNLDHIANDIETLEQIFEYVSIQFANYEKSCNNLDFFYKHKEIEYTYPFELADGRTIEIVTKPIYQDQEYVGNSMSFIDITERTSWIKELKLSEQVFKHSKESILITDNQNRIIKVNDAFTKLTGYTQEEVLGQTPSILKSQWHEDVFFQKLWDTLLEKKYWEGEITDRRKNGELYVAYTSIIMVSDDNNNILNYIGISRDITDMKEEEKRIKSLAFYDILTGLPNRALFHENLRNTLKQSKRDETKVALLFLDLDGFKNVNDTHGHHMGDHLLKAVAKILISCVRESDTVSRLSGDEFTIILRNIEFHQDIELVANKIIERLGEDLYIEESVLHIGSSIGAAIYPDDANTAEELIKKADGAMYKAKQKGKNRLEFVSDKKF